MLTVPHCRLGPPLVRSLLGFPEADAATPRDPAKIPLVELLCRHLTAFRKQDVNEHVSITFTSPQLSC